MLLYMLVCEWHSNVCKSGVHVTWNTMDYALPWDWILWEDQLQFMDCEVLYETLLDKMAQISIFSYQFTISCCSIISIMIPYSIYFKCKLYIAGLKPKSISRNLTYKQKKSELYHNFMH